MAFSRKEVKKRYAEIDTEFGSNGINIYRCKNNHHILTRHDVPGVTPMFINCPCGAQARSSMYNVDQFFNPINLAPLVDISFQGRWYRPSLKWCLRNREKTWLLDHVFKGGLIVELNHS